MTRGFPAHEPPEAVARSRRAGAGAGPRRGTRLVAAARESRGCSRRIVPRLREDGYDVDYREFTGGHTVPGEMASDALSRFLSRP